MSEAARTEQWLFTFDSATGEVCRVEKIDPVSGSGRELSESEYHTLDDYLNALAAESDGALRSNPETVSRTLATQRAYLRGVADCAALYRRYGFL